MLPYLLAILTVIVLVGQFVVIVQCGSIHRRLGPRSLDDLNAISTKIRSLIGRPIDLDPSARFVFGSLTCSHCLTIIRAMDDSTDAISILLADAENSAGVAAFKATFPEITRELRPGKNAFETLQINHLPFYLETDENRTVARIEQLTSPQQLQQLLS